MKPGRPKLNRNMIDIRGRVDEETANQLHIMAETQGRSISNLVAWILTQEVKETMQEDTD